MSSQLAIMYLHSYLTEQLNYELSIICKWEKIVGNMSKYVGISLRKIKGRLDKRESLISRSSMHIQKSEKGGRKKERALNGYDACSRQGAIW